MQIFEWWNLIFALPGIAVLCYQTFMALGMGLPDHDVEVDHDLDHDFDLEHDAEMGHDHEHHGLAKALSLLGVGRVPLSVVVTALGLIWAVVGYSVNIIIGDVIGLPVAPLVWVSMIVAGSFSLLLTSTFARTLGWMLPRTESYAVTKRDMIGTRGTVRFKVTASAGSVQVRDKYGHLQELSCRIREGERSLPANSSVVIVGYDTTQGVFLAAPDRLPEITEGTQG